MPNSWRQALAAHIVNNVPGESVVPFAVSPDGHQAFVADYSASWSGVLAIPIGTGQRTRIDPFANPDVAQVVGGAFDGRWLVWTSINSTTSTDDWTMHVWDSETNRTEIVARAPHNATAALPGPIVIPDVQHGIVAWTQSDGTGSTQLHLLTLASGADRVIVAGHPGAPTFAWPWVLWTEPVTPGEPGVVFAATASDGKPMPTPPPLNGIRPTFLTGGPSSAVWADQGSNRLMAWLGGDAPARVITTTQAGDPIQYPEIAGPLITWTDVHATYVADSRSASYARVTPQYGYALARASGLVIAAPGGSKQSGHGGIRMTLMPIASLPALPKC